MDDARTANAGELFGRLSSDDRVTLERILRSLADQRGRRSAGARPQTCSGVMIVVR